MPPATARAGLRRPCHRGAGSPGESPSTRALNLGLLGSLAPSPGAPAPGNLGEWSTLTYCQADGEQQPEDEPAHHFRGHRGGPARRAQTQGRSSRVPTAEAPGPCPPRASGGGRLAADRAWPEAGPSRRPPRGRAPRAVGRPSPGSGSPLAGLSAALRGALGRRGPAREPPRPAPEPPAAGPWSAESPMPRWRPLQLAAGRASGGSGAARRGKGPGGRAVLQPGLLGRRSGPGRQLSSQKPLPSPRASAARRRAPAPCPRRLRRAALRPGSRSCPRSRAGPRRLLERRRGSASAPPGLVPERPGCERPGAQSHPRLHPARAVGPAVALRVPPSRGGIVRAWAEPRRKHTAGGSGSSALLHGLNLKIIIIMKRKPNAVRMPARPPARRGAASPQRRGPGSPEGAHFSTFNETFEASRGDGRVPGPMGPQLRSRRAGSPPPPAAPARRSSPASASSRPGSAPFPPPLAPADPQLGPVQSLCRNRSHTSWHPVHWDCPGACPKPRGSLGAPRKLHRRVTRVARSLNNSVGLSLRPGPQYATRVDWEEGNPESIQTQ